MTDPEEPLSITLPGGTRIPLSEAKELPKPGPTRADIRHWRKAAKLPGGKPLSTEERQRRRKKREIEARREKRGKAAIRQSGKEAGQ